MMSLYNDNNLQVEDLETWYVAMGMWGVPSMFK